MTKKLMIVIASTGAFAGAVRAEPMNPADSQEDYEQRFIGFDDYGAIDPRTGVLHKVTEPYEGKYKKPLEPAEFYRLVGRDDLAQEYVSRDTRRKTLIGAGAVVALGSLVAARVVALDSQPAPCRVGDFSTFSACASRQSDQARSGVITAAAIGVGGGLVSAALIFAGVLTNPNPVDAVQMRALADRYNSRLKQQLGFQLTPLATPETAGLALGLRF